MPIDRAWQMPNMDVMDPSIIIAEIDAHARATGLKPTTICQHALGNARLYERIKRRCERYVKEAERLRAWMAANPPETQEAAE